MTKGKGEHDDRLPRSILNFLYEKKSTKQMKQKLQYHLIIGFFVGVVEYLEFHLFIEQL